MAPAALCCWAAVAGMGKIQARRHEVARLGRTSAEVSVSTHGSLEEVGLPTYRIFCIAPVVPLKRCSNRHDTTVDQGKPAVNGLTAQAKTTVRSGAWLGDCHDGLSVQVRATANQYWPIATFIVKSQSLAFEIN
jgi:hypothetical protein